MNDSKYYWECMGQNYPFRSDKKYLIYFKGNFSPSHRGHFKTVERFIKIGENIHVMIHQIGSEKRHGVPYHLNREIWQTYIDKLLPQNRIYLVKYYCSDDIFDLHNLSSFDRVIYIRGNENYDIKTMEKKNIYRFRDFIYRLSKMGIGLDFYYLNRPDVKTLCATEFTKILVKTKRRKCKRIHCDCKYKKLKKFFPVNLSKGTAIKLINKIQKYYLIV